MTLLAATGGDALAHDGHTSPEPWTACAHSELGQSCMWENDAHEVHRGTCRAIGDGLMCVRNRPVEHAGAETPPAVQLTTATTSHERGPLAWQAGAVLLATGVAYAFWRRALASSAGTSTAPE
jgi:hypothetical protein